MAYWFLQWKSPQRTGFGQFVRQQVSKSPRTWFLFVPHLCLHPEAHPLEGGKMAPAASGTLGFFSKARQGNLTCSWCSLRAWLRNTGPPARRAGASPAFLYPQSRPGPLVLCLLRPPQGYFIKPLWLAVSREDTPSFLEEGNGSLMPLKPLPLSSPASSYSKV